MLDIAPDVSFPSSRHCFYRGRQTHFFNISLRFVTMNCPSRTDEDILLNPTWNQNPPRFAADLTTCQDLNGIANARELDDADLLRSGVHGSRGCDVDKNQFQEKEKQHPRALGKGVKGFQNGAVAPFTIFRIPLTSP